MKVKNLTILNNEEYAVNASAESTLNVPAEVLDLLTNDKVICWRSNYRDLFVYDKYTSFEIRSFWVPAALRSAST